MNEKNFEILYLSECPLEKLDGLPKDSHIKRWRKQNYAVERIENALESKKVSSRETIRCQCFIEYNGQKYQNSFSAESNRKNFEDVFTAKSGYITYINKQRYHCKIEVENNRVLFNILRKYFRGKKIMVDESKQ